jgi:hypothetical protein
MQPHAVRARPIRLIRLPLLLMLAACAQLPQVEAAKPPVAAPPPALLPLDEVLPATPAASSDPAAALDARAAALRARGRTSRRRHRQLRAKPATRRDIKAQVAPAASNG